MNEYRKSLIRHCEARAARSANDPRTVRACLGNPGTAAALPRPAPEPECVWSALGGPHQFDTQRLFVIDQNGI